MYKYYTIQRPDFQMAFPGKKETSALAAERLERGLALLTEEK